MKRWIVAVCTLSMAALMPLDTVSAQESDELLEKWFAKYAEHAESLDVRLRGEDVNLELHPTPLLKYTNPVRGVQQHGSLYLWTRAGRPGMIGSIWSSMDRQRPDERKLCYEWHSLLEEEVLAARDGEQLWNSGEPGVEWQTDESHEAVAATRPLRLAQMREIVRSLTTEIDAPEGDLRLLSQPLYRYPEDTPDVLDGAVFASVMGTDPELFMLLEARAAEGEENAWQVAFARFGKRPVTVRRGPQELWSCGWARPHERTGRYFLWFIVERLPADLSTGVFETAESGT